MCTVYFFIFVVAPQKWKLELMSETRVYRFQTKVKTHSVNDLLANFLKEKDADLTEKERVWWAVSAFWLPVAMKESQSYTSQEIQQYGLSAIQRLQQQIDHLKLVLEIEVPQSGNEEPLRATKSDCTYSEHGTYVFNESDKTKIEHIVGEQDLNEVSPSAILPTVLNEFDDVFGYE